MTKELTTEDAERWIDVVSDVTGISITEHQRLAYGDTGDRRSMA